MINPRELRIGNIIICNDKISKVLGLTIHNGWGSVWVDSFVYEYDDSSLLYRCEPIPLTEEWLVKFGFDERGGTGYYLDIENMEITPIIICLKNKEFIIAEFGIKLKYVHQLQNLYFALTGKEL